MASITGQVFYVLKRFLRVGEDCSRARRRGERQSGIYNGNTFKFVLNKCCICALWCQQQYGIKLLIEMTQEMTNAFFQCKMLEGKSAYTLRSYRSALRWLQKGIPKAYKLRVRIIPTIPLPIRRLVLRKDRYAYSDEEVAIILKEVRKSNQLVAKALEIQFLFGLRVSECVKLRVRDFDLAKVILYIWYGKGGKDRKVTPSSGQRAFKLLTELLDGKSEMELLFPGVDVPMMCKEIRKACIANGIKAHKTHNLRHSFFVKRFDQALAEGKTDKEARKEGAELGGHGRPKVHYHYAPPRIRPRG